jgi:hypothetical protein
MKTKLRAIVGVAVLTSAIGCSQYTSATDPSTFRGCLQGDTAVGFSLLAPTGDGSGTDTKGQTQTYKVVPSAPDVNLSQMVNKVVEISGAVSTAPADTGQMPAPVTDSIRSPGGAGGTGTPGENTAFIWANGTVTAKSIRELEPTCAVRVAPDQDK